MEAVCTADPSNVLRAFSGIPSAIDEMPVEMEHYREALRIRCVEDTFLDLFSMGKLNGTVHTCVGQEFSAVAFAGQLDPSDFVFSNHRCHGHYLAFTGDVHGLIGELMGKVDGTCGGIGSSQHLCKNNFYSNGIQGGIVPVAAGMALANKLKGNNRIGIVFIGDGTLGQGVVYETFNIVSKWRIPLLIVCENNGYAQSTPQHANLAGEILARARAFGLHTAKSDTWHPGDLLADARRSIDRVRTTGWPAFHLVDTYRLNAHSKGDDEREPDEVGRYRRMDPLNRFKEEHPEDFGVLHDRIQTEVLHIVADLEQRPELSPDSYSPPEASSDTSMPYREIAQLDQRQVRRINAFFNERMSEDPSMVVLGEDIADPYGGAFKATRGLSSKFPERVFNCPISEAAMTGIANGLALAGMKPYLEIMFGDFITLCMDQLINHASKFHHMYNKQVRCPVVIRTPMGGGRGYGPTHSQTLDKFLLGIDNVTVIALNTLVDPKPIYETVHTAEDHPVVVIENKTDYGKCIGENRFRNYVFEASESRYPLIRIRPRLSTPTVTIVGYGGMADLVIDCIEAMIVELDLKPELFVPVKIHPVDCIPAIVDSVRTTGRLFVAEEGSVFTGFGSEIIAAVKERVSGAFAAGRIGSLPVPIPASKSLENDVLPDREAFLKKIGELAS